LLSTLLDYFLLAYAFTWIFHGAISILHLPFTTSLRSPGCVLYMLGIGGPLVSSAILTIKSSGLAGLCGLLSSTMIWRFSPIWYLFAVLPIGTIYLISTGLNTLFGGEAPKRLLNRPSHRIRPAIMGQIWVVVGEEFGWRGFALPRLYEMFGWLGSGLILGIIWAVWHLPLFFVRGSNQYGSSLTRYVLVITMWSVFMTMLYSRTGGSVLICMIFHAASNVWGFVMNVPEEASRYELPMYLALTVVAVVLLPGSMF